MPQKILEIVLERAGVWQTLVRIYAIPANTKGTHTAIPTSLYIEPGIRLRRRIARPMPGEQAPRSSGGDCEPTRLHSKRSANSLHPSQKQGQPEGCPCFWLGWPDSDRRMPESKSGALPLGYTPIFKSTFVIIAYFLKCVKNFFSFSLERFLVF